MMRTPGFSVLNCSALIRRFVAEVSGVWIVMKSDSLSSRSSSTISTPKLRAKSRGTYGSWARMVIANAFARLATSEPTLPRPITPRVLLRSSIPVNLLRVHSPRRMDASACGMFRASDIISAKACSAAAIVLPVGALTTAMPISVAASMSMLSTPTPARPMAWSRPAFAMTEAVTFVSLRTSSAS